jgi:hypothetical protein
VGRDDLLRNRPRGTWLSAPTWSNKALRADWSNKALCGDLVACVVSNQVSPNQVSPGRLSVKG